jgi:hypothetical protein
MKLFKIRDIEVGLGAINMDTSEKLLSPAITGSYKDKAITLSIALWHFKVGIIVSWGC